jgi:nucleoid-associated protein YgaU
LAGRARSLREALKEDLSSLKDEFQVLQAEARDLRRQNPWLAAKAARRKAAQAEKDFNKKAEEIFKKAEKTGDLPKEDFQAVREGQEGVLDKYVDVLDVDPSPGNIGKVYEGLGDALSKGSDPDQGACARATKSVRTAQIRRLNSALGRMKAVANIRNARTVMNCAAAVMLGESDKTSDEAVLQAMKSLLEIVEGMKNKAEKQFRRIPTIENYERMEKVEKLCKNLGGQEIRYPPSVLRTERRGGQYTVQRGDTLSGISQRLYGDPGYWDVIYRNNKKIMGTPRCLRRGMKLSIP